MKHCNKCQVSKPVKEFYANRATCKTCLIAQRKKYLGNPIVSSHYKKYHSDYRKRNAKQIQFYRKKITKEGYYRNHYKNGYKLQRKLYYQNNKSTIQIYKKYHNSKPTTKELKRKYMALLRATNPNYKIRINLARRIREVLKGNSKSASTLSLLGCDIIAFKKHLESKFSPGMNWRNYGLHGWHIDHIRPCDSFDLSDPKQQKECFHYSNLQPLWAKDNIRKSNKLLNSY